MRRRLNPIDQQFHDQMRAFVQQHWQGVDRSWYDALVQQQLSVPHWPVAQGGQGWSDTQCFLWQDLCLQAGAPGTQQFGTHHVGPLLFGSGRADWLAGIRELREKWSWDMAGTTLSCSRLADGWQLDGVLPWVNDCAADWLLVTADDGQAFGVAANHPNMTLGPVQTLDGQQRYLTATLREVVVGDEQRLPRPVSWSTVAAEAEHTEVLPSISRTALDSLRELIAEQDLVSDEDIARRLHELTIDQQALEVLHARWLHALSRSAPLPYPHDVVCLAQQQLLHKLGELQVSCFGYYALPHPDRWLTHNEGEVGPDGTVDAISAWFAQLAPIDPRGSEMARKDRLMGNLANTSTTATNDVAAGTER